MNGVKKYNIHNIYMGKQIAGLRKDHNYSQQDLADLLRRDRASIANIEKGRQTLSIENLLRLLAIFKVSPDKILPPTPEVEIEKQVETVTKTIKKTRLKAVFTF